MSSIRVTIHYSERFYTVSDELILAGKLQLKKLQKKKPEKNSGTSYRVTHTSYTVTHTSYTVNPSILQMSIN